ncbi:serine/threonine-protein phosphatase 2A activator [Nematocida sp. ERTm5]|nr:serine/threonine-protein phosphatase 2A activator [Nematocida sp. AWRm79]KAI5182734.1 serine/threonine-protein phosphatase 2A activator [Nematocida sp. AWRm78]OAG33415.1 serine/threonine-protein phosphatase 2A activator [Nematocida sp. ERTm5]
MAKLLYKVDPEHWDVARFKSSAAYKTVQEYLMKIDQMIQNNEIPGDIDRYYDISETRNIEEIEEMIEKRKEEGATYSKEDILTPGNLFLIKIEEIIKEVPIEEGNQRYGNKGFINFAERILIEGERLLKESFPSLETKDVRILQEYLQESFGNKSRIDYGTGHELNFFCFVIILLKLGIIQKKSVLLVLEQYFSIIRLLILKYKLEPAGSHGMGGLDDYQLLPFLFGSSQFCRREGFAFAFLFSEKEKGLSYAKALRFIHIDKTFPPSKYTYKERIEKYNSIELTEEPFSHHSITIYSLRSVPLVKINKGMLKMYDGVVLTPYAVVQHFISSEYLPI